MADNGVGGYTFPQKASALRAGENGIASITWKNDVLRFRTNPNQFSWTYNLKKRIDQTYGGRVVQLLGTTIDDFSLKADSGRGGWAYNYKVAKFCRDVMVGQRDGTPCTFEYTTRGWKFNAYIISVPFNDAVEEVLREFEIQMKVQEDVSQVLSKNSLDKELRDLSDGIGFRRSKYNDPVVARQGETLVDVIGDGLGAITEAAAGLAGIVQTVTGSNGGGIFLPNGLNVGK